jgi:hypothetical protein
MTDGNDGVDDRSDVHLLLANIKASLTVLETLLQECSSHWGYEDPLYRFYHQSFKVYDLQTATSTIVTRLQILAPDRELNGWFRRIVADGTGHAFDLEHNRRWLEVTRPIVEAFLHARFFLEMAVRYGNDLATPPRVLPSGWAALLYLYGLR